MPYLYSQAITTHQTGIPMLRAMFLEYPSDPAVWHLDQQYMLGDSLLVAPVFSEDDTVTYYLPSGQWYGIIDQKIRKGPGYITETFDFMGLPVLLKPGSAVVLGKGGEKIEYDWADGFKLLVNFESDMDIVVEIPHHENLGKSAVSLRITASEATASINVIDGKAKSPWDLHIVNRQIKGVNNGTVSGEGIVSIPAEAVQIAVTL